MSRDSVHEETYRGCAIRLEYYQSPESPRAAIAKAEGNA
jgi:hypothetical protein